MHILVINLANGRKKSQQDIRNFWIRFYFYLGFVILYGILTVSTMNATNNWTLDGIWCWVKIPMDRIYYAYVALWVVTIITISVSIATVVRLRATLQSQEAAGAIKNIDKSKVNFYARMFMGPLLFVALHIPGSTRRLGQAFDFQFSAEKSNNLSMSQSFMDPLHGGINFFLYVILDGKQRREWKKLFQKLYDTILRYNGYKKDYDGEDSMGTPKCSMSSTSSIPVNPIHFHGSHPGNDVDEDKDMELNMRPKE